MKIPTIGALVTTFAMTSSGALANEEITCPVSPSVSKNKVAGCFAEDSKSIIQLSGGKCKVENILHPKTGVPFSTKVLRGEYTRYQKYTESGARGLFLDKKSSFGVTGNSPQVSCQELMKYAGKHILDTLK